MRAGGEGVLQWWSESILVVGEATLSKRCSAGAKTLI